MDTAAAEQIEDLENKEIIRQYRALVRACRPSMQRGDSKLIRRAFELAAEAHKDMRRKSGEPYILHPLAVAQIVAKEIGLGITSVICALLHDTVEDTDVSLDQIEKEFGKDISNIIDGLTKIKGVTHNTGTISLQAENLKKILLTLSEDVRVIIIKIADRLHNMRTLKSMPEKKQLRISSETLYLYAPVAHRLGLYALKTELEDLSLKYTAREQYLRIAKKLHETKRDRDKYINEFIKPIKKQLKEGAAGSFSIAGRSKSIHSIFNKIQKKRVAFEDIYDLFAIRIIVDVPYEIEKAECWRIYSVVTDLYKPNPERLRDWISTPKSNGYESLHTTVMGPGGKWVEVQIRTKRMDEVAEKGVAAHWKYKGGEADGALEVWLAKVRDYLQDPASNAMDFMTDFRHNLYENEVYVFTPKGDLKTMRADATVLDFAFDIHTEIGSTCMGAKINGKLVPLSSRLSNGDQIEIITSKKQKPSEDWLNFAVTSRARTKIKSHLKDEKRRVASDGKEMLERKLRSLKLKYSSELVDDLSRHFKQEDSLTFLYNVAIKKFDLNELKKLTFVGNKIQILSERKPIAINKEEVNIGGFNKDADLLIFGGFADMVDYSIASCCKPVAGDDVFGFITINSGIKIHQTTCPNAPELISKYGYRVVKTKWGRKSNLAFLTGIKITGIDDVGLINRLTSVISDKLKINMRSISFDTQDGVFEGNINVYVQDVKELSKLIKEVRKVNGVHDVKRYDT